MRNTGYSGGISILALCAASVMGAGSACAQTVTVSPAQLQAQLETLQSQINLLKSQEKQLSREAAAVSVQEHRQAVVAQQQASVAAEQARVAQQQNQVSLQVAATSAQAAAPMKQAAAGSGGLGVYVDNGALVVDKNIRISLHGRVFAYGANMSSDANSVGGNKLSPISGVASAVLLPSVDFKESPGLHYGVKSVFYISETAAGVGANTNSSSATTPVEGTPSFVLHFGYVYAASKRYGTVNLGQEPGTWTFMEVGNPDLDNGGWDSVFEGGLPAIVPSDVRPFYLHGTVNALDATIKVSYVSPTFDGFTIGASYEPNSNGSQQGNFTCTGAGSTCADLQASTLSTDIGKKRQNTVDAAIAYAGQFGATSFATSAGVLYGSPVSFDGPPTTATTDFLPLAVGRAGAELTTPLGAGQLTLSGNTEFGQVEDTYAFQPKGAPDAFEYIVGAAYNIGPWKMVGAYFSNRTSGAFNPKTPVTGRYELETGPEAELAYTVNDHWKVMLNYLYGSRQQAGFDFLTGADGKANNYVRVQVVGLGTQVVW